MRPLAELNHYELLDLSFGVTSFDIRQAYKAALELYSEDSMLTHSLFSAEERKEILAGLDEAFATLINDETRQTYDEMLVQKGVLKRGGSDKDPGKSLSAERSDRSTEPTPQENGGKPPAMDNPVVIEILSREVLTGKDLERLRMELGVSVDLIAEGTKIRPGMLRCIEEDRFSEFPSRFHLKSFLKAYAKYMHLNPESVVERYMKRIQP
jgi:hypothetical protein